MNPSTQQSRRQQEHPAVESQSPTSIIRMQHDIAYSGRDINPTRSLVLIPEFFGSQRVLPARYRLITSPFCDIKGGSSYSVSIDNYKAGRALWRQFYETHKDIAASRAFAADSVRLTHLDRKWLLQPSRQGESFRARMARFDHDLRRIESSGWEIGIESLASRCGIQIEKLRDPTNPLASWTLSPPEKNRASPVNSIAELLQINLNIRTYITTIDCHGVYYRRGAERAGAIVFSPACFTDSPGDFMNTSLHETIHGIFDLDLKTSAGLTTYRGQREARDGSFDAYARYLHYNEILAHVGGALFLPVSGIAADSDPKKHPSVVLLDQLVSDSQFMAHVLAQYDFIRSRFDNGNHGSCSAPITLSRGSDNSIELTVQLCGRHHLELTREQHDKFAFVLGGNDKIDLMKVFEAHPEAAKQLLGILQERIKSCGEAAEIGREIILDLARLGASISEDPNQFNLPDVLAHARQRVLTLPGLKQLFDSIPNLLDLFEGAYRQVAGFETDDHPGHFS